MAQGGPVALGNHAGEDAVRDLVDAAGLEPVESARPRAR